MNNSLKHIMIVDDEIVNAQLFQEFLEDRGFRVTYAPTAAAGLKFILDDVPDLILLDLYLPDMMGSDFCAQLRSSRATAHIPIILCTAYQISMDEKMKGFRNGVDDYLIRPFELNEMLARIHAVLRRSQARPKNEVLASIESLIKRPGEEPETPSRPLTVAAVSPTIKPATSALPKKEPLSLLSRCRDTLFMPVYTFRSLDPPRDMVIGWLMVVGAPTLSSVGPLINQSGGFDAWMGAFSIGLVTNIAMWLVLGGALHLSAPFQGSQVTLKKALALTGLAWIPRLIGASLAALYSVIGAAFLAGQTGEFSAGVDLIPGVPFTPMMRLLGRISLFDIWSAVLLMIGTRCLLPESAKKWNAAVVLSGGLCVLFGALTAY